MTEKVKTPASSLTAPPVHMPTPQPAPAPATLPDGRLDRWQFLQRAAGNHALGHFLYAQRMPGEPPQPGPATQAALANRVGGQPLPASARTGMERAFGADLSPVRVHTNSQAARAAGELQAAAFTSGQDIFFHTGRYQPNTTTGRSLLAHELTHTLQQHAGPSAALPPATSSYTVSHPDEPLEREAAAVANRVMAGQPLTSQPPAAPGSHGAQRQLARQANTAAGPAPHPASPAAPPSTPAPQPATAPAPAEAGAASAIPAEEVSLTNATFAPSPGVAAYLEAQRRRGGPVHVGLGTLARGDITVRKSGDNYETRGQDPQAIPLTHPALEPVRAAGVQPVLAVRIRENVISGYLTIMTRRGTAGNPTALVSWIQEHSQEMGWLGFDVSRIPTVKNELKDGILRLQLTGFPFQLAGFLNGTADFGLENEVITFHAMATVHVQGLTDAPLEITRDAQGQITGRIEVPVNLANFSGRVLAVYGNGTVNIEGTVRYSTEKLTGEVTILVTDAATARSVALQRLGPEAIAAAGDQASTDTSAGPRPGPRALAGWGVLDFAFTPWLTGRAQVIIDNAGHVTVVGEIAPPAEIELFAQRDYVYSLFTLEVRTLYGVPLVGNVFLFANIGMDALAKLGPGKIYNIRIEGTYSTDPQVFNRFSIQGTLNISAFAGLRLRAEGGVGVELLGHDIKAGVGLNALAGVRGYVEATPTIGYREKEDPLAGRQGEFYLKGHLEIAAQPFLGLSGDLFVELDSPWWSPAPDDKWTWPLGQLEYPLPGEFGIGADIDYVLGSGALPEIQFGEVDFNKDKFMTDLLNDHVPPRSQGDQETQGKWQEEETTGASAPPTVVDTQGAPAADTPAQGQQQPGAGEVPAPAVQSRWLQGLQALGTLAEQSKRNPFSHTEINAALTSLKTQYKFVELRAAQAGEDWSVYARMNPDNKNNPTKVEGEAEGATEAGTGAAAATPAPPAPAAAPTALPANIPSLSPGELVRVYDAGAGWLVGDFQGYHSIGTTQLLKVKVGKIGKKTFSKLFLSKPVTSYGTEWQRYTSGATSINYGALDALGRPTGIQATLGLPLPTGSDASSSITPAGFQGAGAGHARGHLLGKQLGGSGIEARNLVTLFQTPVNSPIMRGYENQVRAAVESGEIVTYKATPVYQPPKPMPIAIMLEATGNGGFSLSVSVLNQK